MVRIEEGDIKSSRIWNNMMDKYHYLGSGPLCWAQIRYMIKSSLGVIGGLSFSSASFSLESRDRWIGWDKEEREKNLGKIIQTFSNCMCNLFWILDKFF